MKCINNKVVVKSFCLLLSFCTNVLHAQNNQVVEINLISAKDYQYQLKLSDIAESVEYIPLETHKQSIIGDRAGATLTDDYIFIGQYGAVLQFDKNGKFVRQINKVGQGPGECFARCSAFDEKNQLIYLYNNFTERIMIYGYDGKFKRSFKDSSEGGFADGMICDEKGNLLLSYNISIGMKYNYVVVDPNGKIIYKDLHYKDETKKERIKYVLIIEGYKAIYPFDETLFYYKIKFSNQLLSDTVFRIMSDYKSIPSHIITIPETKHSIGRVMESSRYFYVFHSISNDNFLSLYDKQIGKLISNAEWTIINNIDGGPDIEISDHNGGRYAWQLVQPFKLREKLIESKTNVLYPEKQKALKELVNRLDDEDNPVLMIVKLK
jgi:hypothetical protein